MSGMHRRTEFTLLQRRIGTMVVLFEPAASHCRTLIVPACVMMCWNVCVLTTTVAKGKTTGTGTVSTP